MQEKNRGWSRAVARRAVAVASASMIGFGALTAVAAAPAQAATLCYATQDAPFYTQPGGSYIYTVAAGGAIAWDNPGVYYDYAGHSYLYGHGNGHSSGYVRADRTTCNG